MKKSIYIRLILFVLAFAIILLLRRVNQAENVTDETIGVFIIGIYIISAYFFIQWAYKNKKNMGVIVPIVAGILLVVIMPITCLVMLGYPITFYDIITFWPRIHGIPIR